MLRDFKKRYEEHHVRRGKETCIHVRAGRNALDMLSWGSFPIDSVALAAAGSRDVEACRVCRVRALSLGGGGEFY